MEILSSTIYWKIEAHIYSSSHDNVLTKITSMHLMIFGRSSLSTIPNFPHTHKRKKNSKQFYLNVDNDYCVIDLEIRWLNTFLAYSAVVCRPEPNVESAPHLNYNESVYVLLKIAPVHHLQDHSSAGTQLASLLHFYLPLHLAH